MPEADKKERDMKYLRTNCMMALLFMLILLPFPKMGIAGSDGTSCIPECNMKTIAYLESNLDSVEIAKIVSFLNSKPVIVCGNAAEFTEMFNTFIFTVLEKKPDAMFAFMDQGKGQNIEEVLSQLASPVIEQDLEKIKSIVNNFPGNKADKDLLLHSINLAIDTYK